MPYTCSAYGGRVELTPSRDESYRIYGQREERPYTVCSPINPNACRTWLLHRFDLDCGGERVDWLSVVEAASEQTTGRAWVENGRLRMRMNQYWSRDGGQDDDPCPRWRRHGPYGDDCAGRGGSRRRGSGRGDAARLRTGVRSAHSLCRQRSAADACRPARRPGGFGEGRTLLVGAQSSRRATCPRVTCPAGSRSPKTRSRKTRSPKTRRPRHRKSRARRPRRPAHHRVRRSRPCVLPRRRTFLPTRAGLSRPSPSRRSLHAKWQPPNLPHRPAAPARAASCRGSSTARLPSRPHPATAWCPSRPRRTWRRCRSRYLSKLPRPSRPSSRPRPSKPSITFSAKPSTVSEAAPGHSTFTALTPSATTQALVGFAGLVAIALGLFAWTRHREQLSLAAAGGREFGSVNFAKGDAKPSVWSRGSALPRPQAARATPPQTTKTPAPDRRTGSAHTRGGVRGAGREPRCRRGGHQEDCRRPAPELASRPRHQRGGPPAARAAHDADQRCLGDSVRQAPAGLSVARGACGNAIFRDPIPYVLRYRSIRSQVAISPAPARDSRCLRSVNRNHIL